MSEKYTRPFIEVGMTVHWWQGARPNGQPAAAIVTQVGDRTIDLAVASPGYSNFHVRPGVCHVTDPDLQRGNRFEAGCWQHTPLNGRLLAVLNELEPQIKPPAVAKLESPAA